MPEDYSLITSVDQAARRIALEFNAFVARRYDTVSDRFINPFTNKEQENSMSIPVPLLRRLVTLLGEYCGTDGDRVVRILDSQQWSLTRAQDSSMLTDEANIEFAWMVRRTTAPYCTQDGEFQWDAPTPLEAFERAASALNLDLPK